MTFRALRTLAPVAVLLVLSACTPEPQPRVVRDLVIVAGQSNAVGYDADPALLAPDAADSDVMFWWRTGDPPPDEHDSSSGGIWLPLGPQPVGDPLPTGGRNFASERGGFGPEIGLARSLAGDGRLAIVKAAWNGTGMQQGCWRPAGACYRALVDEVRLARAAGADADFDLHPRAIVWIQGEADSVPPAVADYERALEETLTALRRDLEAPALAVLLGVNARFGDRSSVRPRMQKILDAQRAVASRIGRAAFVDTDGASLANDSHFDAAGTVDVGRRFAVAMKELEASAGKPEVPPAWSSK